MMSLTIPPPVIDVPYRVDPSPPGVLVIHEVEQTPRAPEPPPRQEAPDEKAD